MMITQTDRSTYLDVSKIQWEPTTWPGIYTKTLYKDPSGKQTTLTKMDKGAKLPKHKHVGLEQSYVLEGTLVDDDGACTAGNFVWRRPGSIHAAWSPDGCIVLGVFDSPNEFMDEGARPAS
jgi:anti-sigma factor ChrR (cupin superfamily)